MIITNAIFSIFFIINSSGSCDSLKLPVRNGKIINENIYADKLNKAILIEPTIDFGIYSCSDGKISAINKDDQEYQIIITQDSLMLMYSIVDSASVLKGQVIKKGDLIGFKTNKTSNEKYIMFSVFKGTKEINAKDYLVNINTE